MTAPTTEPTPPRSATPRTPAADRSPRRAGLTAGVGLVLMAVLAGVGVFGAVEGLVTPDDVARTVADIRAAERLFRLGIVSLFGVVVLDVVVAWALHGVFRGVHASLSRLAAAFRLVYAGVFLVAIAELAAILPLVGDGAAASILDAEQVEVQVMLQVTAFEDLWSAGLLLFGCHLLLVGLLAYRSGVVPRWLGLLVAVAGLGYVVDSTTAVLAPSVPEVATVTFLGEVLLALWFLVRNRRLDELGLGAA